MTVYEFQANHPGQPSHPVVTPQNERSSAGLRAAARLHDLREIALPAAVAEAAAELLEASTDWCTDTVARDAVRGTVMRLRQALGEQPAWL
ncbi:hypothetical protein [Kitasatospora sp. NPDC088346]|uniref:hypothetical protein n=1 Tax=Kitasatospora sp. NPDC088346 TaxID=3364073 RepID=UPI003807C58B